MTDDGRQFWDEQAGSFDDEADHGLRDPVVRDAWRTLLRSVVPARPSDVADLGCGTGSLSVLMAEEGHRVTGIDSSANMIVAASSKAAKARVAVTFRQGDAARPELAERSMDAVVVRHVVWALPEPRDAITRWAGLLRAHGRLILIEGRWSTGAGIAAQALRAIVGPIFADVDVRSLTDEALWGSPMPDERYLLVAQM